MSDATDESRLRLTLHGDISRLCSECDALMQSLHRIAGTTKRIVEHESNDAACQAALQIGLDAMGQIRLTRQLWDELLDLKRAALGGRETP